MTPVTYRPLPVRLSRVVRGCALRARRRQATFVCLVALALAVRCSLPAPRPAEPPAIAAKRAEAQRVLNEIHSLDVQLEKAIEAYNGATDQLAAIERERALNSRHLVDRRNNLTSRSGGSAPGCARSTRPTQDDSTLAILLGSHSRSATSSTASRP